MTNGYGDVVLIAIIVVVILVGLAIFVWQKVAGRR